MLILPESYRVNPSCCNLNSDHSHFCGRAEPQNIAALYGIDKEGLHEFRQATGNLFKNEIYALLFWKAKEWQSKSGNFGSIILYYRERIFASWKQWGDKSTLFLDDVIFSDANQSLGHLDKKTFPMLTLSSFHPMSQEAEPSNFVESIEYSPNGDIAFLDIDKFQPSPSFCRNTFRFFGQTPKFNLNYLQGIHDNDYHYSQRQEDDFWRKVILERRKYLQDILDSLHQPDNSLNNEDFSAEMPIRISV